MPLDDVTSLSDDTEEGRTVRRIQEARTRFSFDVQGLLIGPS
jgi:hypothetical protein